MSWRCMWGVHQQGSISDAVDRGWFRKKRSLFETDFRFLITTAREIAGAMCYLHGRNILHGDLTGVQGGYMHGWGCGCEWLCGGWVGINVGVAMNLGVVTGVTVGRRCGQQVWVWVAMWAAGLSRR